MLPQEEKNKKHVNGLAQGPVIMYLDSLLLLTDTKEMRKIANTMDKTSLPQANHLKVSDLAKIARAHMKRDRKARPDDYEFGKIQTWKGTAERIFYASTASTSSSIHQIAREHRKQQQHQHTTKLLPPPPKRWREPRVDTSGSRERNKSISTLLEERFQRIKKLLEKVLHEAEQLPADIVCTRYLTDNATLQTLEQADPAASSRLADANHTNEIIATKEPRERRKIKKEEDEERKRRTKSRDMGIDKKKIKRQKQECTNSTPGQDELQQQDGVNNPKNKNERNKQSNLTTDNATTTTTPTQAQDTIDVRTSEEAQLENNQVSSPANQMQEADPQSTVSITNDKEEENNEEEVSQALQDQEITRVEIEPHSEPQTDEGVTEQEVCVQEISSATTLQITITSIKEKAQDIPADEKLETVIPDKEIVDAGTNNPVINTEETNEYVDLEDQEATQPKETGKHTELQTTTSEEEEEASESTGIDIEQEKQEDNTRQGETVVLAVDSPATPEKEAQEAQESTNNQDHQTQPEEPNEQPEHSEEASEQKEATKEGQHVLQTADINVTEDQAPKYSLTEKHAAETAAATMTEKLQDKNDGSGDELQKKEQEDDQKPPLNEEQAQQSAAATRIVAETTKVATIEELQDKNHDSDDEHQKKEQEDPQETTLNKERVEQSASPTTAQQKHEEGDHGDTTNQANTQILPEKELETIKENLTPSYDANSPGREVSANQVETEKQDGKDHQQDMTVDKEKHDAKKITDDSNEDGAETEQKGTMQKEHNMPQEAEGEQERNNSGQGISSSIEAGTMEKGGKDSDSVNKAIEDLYNAVCKPWTQREMDELFITTDKFDVNLGHIAESFKFLLPCSLRGFEKDEIISHYFTITVNMQKQRFELLDSSTAYPGTIEFFNNVTSKLMKIWKHVSTELQLSQKNIDHFKKVKLQVPLQEDETMDCAFYMYMNLKHYSNDGTAATLEPEQYEVDMEEKEMQQIECCILEEFPPNPEPKEHIMHATTTKEHEVIDISSKRKEIMDVSSHAVAQESCTDHEEKDPPIEPDQPPPDDKIPHHAEEETDEQNINSNITSTEQLEQTGTDLKEDDRSNDVPNTQEQMGHTFDEIKTAMIYQEDFEFNRNATPYLTSLQQESGEHSMGQSSKNSSDKKISVKKRTIVLGVKTGEEEGLAEFNEDEALKQFAPLVTGKELLKKKLIMIHHNTAKHYTLYVLNKYTSSIDILDSLNYRHRGGKNTWKTHHKDHPELVPRIKEVFNAILEQTMNPKKTRWQIHTVQDVPVVEKGESPFAVLKLAFLYNGEKFVEDLEDLTDEVEDWRAEAMYILLSSEMNQVKASEMGDEISKIFSKNED
nr:trichohyalin-like [Aegilops tauschii subsp. strangulata]